MSKRSNPIVSAWLPRCHWRPLFHQSGGHAHPWYRHCGQLAHRAVRRRARPHAGLQLRRDRHPKHPAEPGDPGAERLNLQRIGRAETGRTRSAHRATSSPSRQLDARPLGLRFTLSRYGEFTVLNTNPTNDQTFTAKWVLDLAADYTLDNWTFTLDANNVFNEYPTG